MKVLTIFERYPAWKWAAAALVLLCLYAIFSKAGRISEDVRERACSVVSEFGLDCNEVLCVKGRDVVLKGEIPPGLEKSELIKKIASLRGVRSVEDRLKPYVLKRPWLRAKISGNQLTMEGLLPSSVSIKDLKKAVLEKVPGRTVTAEIKTGPKVQAADWIKVLPELLALASGVVDAEISLEGKTIKISGYVSSQSEKIALADKLKEAAGGLDVTNWLIVKVPEEIMLEEALAKVAKEPISFVPGSDELTLRSKRVLNEVAEVLKAYPGTRLEVAAYTDSVGDDEYNLELSQRRAESVANYLISKGVQPERLEARGYGEADPVASNESASGRMKNRRIEFRIISKNNKG